MNRDHSVVFEIASMDCSPPGSSVYGILQLTPKTGVLFFTDDRHAIVGSVEIPGVMGKFGLGVQNEAGKRLTEFCQENALVIANILFQ